MKHALDLTLFKLLTRLELPDCVIIFTSVEFEYRIIPWPFRPIPPHAIPFQDEIFWASPLPGHQYSQVNITKHVWHMHTYLATFEKEPIRYRCSSCCNLRAPAERLGCQCGFVFDQSSRLMSRCSAVSAVTR